MNSDSKMRHKLDENRVFIIPIIIFLTLALLVLSIVAICCGHYSIDPITCLKILCLSPFDIPRSWSGLDESVIFGLRIPRILAAILVGFALSISGAVYQSTFQNPLVSPDILGVSSGACVGAAVGILLHLSSIYIMILAFSCAIITVSLTVLIPKLLKSSSNIMLVLSGILMGGLASSILGIITYIADPASELPQIIYWTMGSLEGIPISTLLYVSVPIIITIILLIRMSWWIDILSLGEKDAQTLGANVGKIRIITIVCSTLLTALTVCMCGTIAWVGLVVPHFARMIIGPNNTRLLPTAAIMGAIFLVIVDTIARSLTVTEVPIGIITGLIGAPFYVWLLYSQKNNLN